jgi:hypothetical protein
MWFLVAEIIERGKRGDMINAGNGIITGWPKPSMMMDRLEAEM